MILAIVNNKGGVGKTTTVQNLAAGMLRKDKTLRTLGIDLDPQCNLTLLNHAPEGCATVFESMIACRDYLSTKQKQVYIMFLALQRCRMSILFFKTQVHLVKC